MGRLPQHLVVYSEILMNELVSHPSHLFPLDLRMSLRYRRWNLLGRFTDNLERSDHGIDGFLILRKLGHVMPAINCEMFCAAS